MNDNQYICHSSEIICHAGKKGMKWGQGPYSKLKGYVYRTADAIRAAGQANALQKEINADNKSVEAIKDRIALSRERADTADYYKNSNMQAIKSGMYNRGKITGFNSNLEELSKQVNKNQADYNKAKYDEYRASRDAGRRQQAISVKQAKINAARERAKQSLFGRARLVFGNPKKKKG